MEYRLKRKKNVQPNGSYLLNQRLHQTKKRLPEGRRPRRAMGHAAPPPTGGVSSKPVTRARLGPVRLKTVTVSAPQDQR